MIYVITHALIIYSILFFFNDTATTEIYPVLTHSFPTRRSSDLPRRRRRAMPRPPLPMPKRWSIRSGAANPPRTGRSLYAAPTERHRLTPELRAIAGVGREAPPKLPRAAARAMSLDKLPHN